MQKVHNKLCIRCVYAFIDTQLLKTMVNICKSLKNIAIGSVQITRLPVRGLSIYVPTYLRYRKQAVSVFAINVVVILSLCQEREAGKKARSKTKSRRSGLMYFANKIYLIVRNGLKLCSTSNCHLWA